MKVIYTKYIHPRAYLILFLLLYFLFVNFTYKDYGVAIDEPMEYGFGEMLYNRYFGRDPQLIHDFAVEGINSREIWSHNHFQVMLMYIFNDGGELSRYHFLSLLFATLGFWLTYEIMLEATKKPIMGLVGSTLLFFTPRYLGDIPSNVKDPVFAVYYLLALYATIVSSKIKKPWIKIIFLGLSFGLAVAQRTVGYSIFLVYLIIAILDKRNVRKLIFKDIGSIILEVVLILIIAVFIHGIEMPFVMSDPIKHLPKLMEVARNFPWQGQILYLGKLVNSGSLPWHYLPAWTIVITPVFILIFGGVSHFYFKKTRVIRVLLTAFWINLILYYLIKPVIYDGIRHYLYLLVIFTVLAALGWATLWLQTTKVKRHILTALLILNFMAISLQYYLLHPYEYTYFNAMIGFLPGAANKFETDYWGTSYYEGARWLISYLDNNNPQTIGLCGNEYAKRYFINTKHNLIWMPNCEPIPNQKLNYVMAYGRGGEWNKIKDEEIYSVKRLNTPLMKIFEVLPTDTTGENDF